LRLGLKELFGCGRRALEEEEEEKRRNFSARKWSFGDERMFVCLGREVKNCDSELFTGLRQSVMLQRAY
jgi:hypothetical protein